MPTRVAPAILASLALAAAAPACVYADEAHHWAYGTGHGGPGHWAELEPGFAACGTGKQQSPIDIRGAQKAQLPAIQLAYQAGPAKVENNGHTIQVTPAAGSTLTVGDHTYELVQFHFHAPSEEAVGGKRAPLVAHFVHKDADGHLAVLATLFEVGAENAALKPIFAKLPSKPHSELELTDVRLDPAAVLPASHGYYEFEGSLTTPPCSEGVRWLVLQKHATVSKAQLQAFTKLYAHNARPLQPLNGRAVRASM
ncbi:MAG TPA: carbonic anhydrase family protein [Anaeromyxobacteraceae bacterium]|nr:carbonic anhydrase family protein [Anaeromyxobacteraceae bacterium]